jgi:hypothetical protein
MSILAGKKISSLLLSSKIQSGDAKHAIRHYNELLNFLTTHGALLSNVKAEFLLSSEEYRAVILSHESQKQRSAKMEHSEISEAEENYKHFSLVSIEAWGCLTLQILRIFLFPAVSCNLAKFLHDDDQIDVQQILQSHFSGHPSATDSFLLAWVGSVLKKVSLGLFNFFNFFEILGNRQFA